MNLTFDIWFPGPIETFSVFLALLLVFIVVWVAKYLISLYTGAGAG